MFGNTVAHTRVSMAAHREPAAGFGLQVRESTGAPARRVVLVHDLLTPYDLRPLQLQQSSQIRTEEDRVQIALKS